MKQVRAETGIVHLRTANRTDVKTFLLGSDLSPLPISPDSILIDEWLYYGCIYVDGLRLRENQELQEGQLIRLHTRRKKYALSPLPLSERLVANEEEFVVIDKPSGVPTHPTLDNYVDNVQYRLSQELKREILVTHRLDVATQGLLILAKNKNAQAAINKAFAKGRVNKWYRALTAKPISEGLHTHYINPETRVPREISDQPHTNWWECKLEVTLSQAHHLGFRADIRLFTGKTHQIRAQFAALGAPVLGDVTYGSSHAFLEGGIALECFAMEFPFRLETYSLKRAKSLVEV